jgi:hypothetical protein
MTSQPASQIMTSQPASQIMTSQPVLVKTKI